MTINSELTHKFSKIQLLALDFDGVLTNNMVFTNQLGEESVACWRSDGLGLSQVKKLGIPIWVISTEKNPVVSTRCQKLGIECLQNCDDKLSALINLLNKYNEDLDHVAFIGNDINDASCLKKVGLPIIVAESHQDINGLGKYKTLKYGGRGAVREVCDLIVKYNPLSK